MRDLCTTRLLNSGLVVPGQDVSAPQSHCAIRSGWVHFLPADESLTFAYAEKNYSVPDTNSLMNIGPNDRVSAIIFA